jgi:hypothetical protein
MKHELSAGLLWLLLLLIPPAVGASDIDLHWLWDNRCVDCHGHAGEFSRQFLTDANGELQGRHHIHDLRRFMQNHYLNADEVDAVYTMLLAQTRTQARFKNECSRCHGSAATFVRQSLQLRDGQLTSLRPGRNVRTFLATHQGLNADDVEFFIKQLSRVANEVNRPIR